MQSPTSSSSDTPQSPSLFARATSFLKTAIVGESKPEPMDASKMGTREGGTWSTKSQNQDQLPLHHQQPALNQLNRDIDVVTGRDSNTAEQNVSVSDHLTKRRDSRNEDDEKASSWRLFGRGSATHNTGVNSYPHVYNSTVNMGLHRPVAPLENEHVPELHHKWHDSHNLDLIEEKSNDSSAKIRQDKLGQSQAFVDDVKSKLGMTTTSDNKSSAIYHNTKVDTTQARRSTATSDFVHRALSGWSDQ